MKEEEELLAFNKEGTLTPLGQEVLRTVDEWQGYSGQTPGRVATIQAVLAQEPSLSDKERSRRSIEISRTINQLLDHGLLENGNGDQWSVTVEGQTFTGKGSPASPSEERE